MTEYLNPQNIFHGEVVHPVGSIVNLSGDLRVGQEGSAQVGINAWQLVRPPVRVGNVVERDAYLQHFSEEYLSPTPENPCQVWRADAAFGGALESYDGTRWQQLSPVSGDMEMTLAASAPPGWALAIGQTLTDARTTYPALWNAVDPTWRSGANNIKLPDLRGRMPVGAGKGSGLTHRYVGNTGGAEKVTLSQANTPLKRHRHAGYDWREIIDRRISGSETRSGRMPGNKPSGDANDFMVLAGSKWTRKVFPSATPEPDYDTSKMSALGSGPWPTSITGSDDATPHENMPPFVVVNYKIKL